MGIMKTRMAFLSQMHKSPFVLLLPLHFLLYGPLPCLSQATQTVNDTSPDNTASTGNYTSQDAVLGCGAGLDPAYTYLCDRQAAWGIVLESLASLGFVVTVVLLVALLLWSLWLCASSRRQQGCGVGGEAASMLLFLLATAGVFALTFAFVVRLNPRTCPTRLFLFGVLFSLAFSSLLARCLALLGFGAAQGWGEPALAVALAAVQVIIATQWLLLVLVRDGLPCIYGQGEFAMLLIYVMCLLAAALLLSLGCLCHSCRTYGYGPHGQGRGRAALLCLTLMLSACIWVAWIALLTRGNQMLGRRPAWDDPVLAVALVANGWVLLVGHGLAQVASLCRGELGSQDTPLSFAGWTSPTADIPGLGNLKEGRENRSYETDGEDKRGRRTDPVLRSPYESGFSMTEIDPGKDYTIPRPQTTNIGEPYNGYYKR